MTDFRAKGTIMGLTGLTAVFGMGTGGAPPVSSPESGRRGYQAPSAVGGSDGWSHSLSEVSQNMAVAFIPDATLNNTLGSLMSLMVTFDRVTGFEPAAADRGGQAVGC